MLALAALTIPHSLPDQLRSSLEQAVDAAFVDAFRAIMLLAAGLAVAAGVVAWRLIEPSEKPDTGPGTTRYDEADRLRRR